MHGLIQFAASKGLGAVGIQHTAALSSDESFALMVLMLALSIIGASATYAVIEIAGRRHLRAVLGDARKTKAARALGEERV